jgi:hypothetical protein
MRATEQALFSFCPPPACDRKRGHRFFTGAPQFKLAQLAACITRALVCGCCVFKKKRCWGDDTVLASNKRGCHCVTRSGNLGVGRWVYNEINIKSSFSISAETISQSRDWICRDSFSEPAISQSRDWIYRDSFSEPGLDLRKWVLRAGTGSAETIS